MVSLPIAAEVPAPVTPETATLPSMPNGTRILVIDDEPLAGKTLADLLRDPRS